MTIVAIGMHDDATDRRIGLGKIAALAMELAVIGAAGCVHPRVPMVISDPDPTVKIPAIKKEVDEKDLSERVQLVKALDSDDPAVRFYAIGALERLTGETFQYVYYQDDAQRQEPILKWRSWLERQAPATVPVLGR